MIVAGAPDGAIFVADRAPQLGKGVKVRIIDDGSGVQDTPEPVAPELVELDPEQQKKMIAFIEANSRMPADMKSRILDRLRTGKAPQRMVDRITKRMGS